MDALVDSQRGPLDELFAAVGVVAHVGTDATVDTFCNCQCVLFEVEAQAPYHDVQGHCVARSPCRMSNTRKLSVGPRRRQDGHPGVAAGRALVVADHMRVRAVGECTRYC